MSKAIFDTYIIINISLRVREQEVYVFIIPFIAVSIILRNKFKNDMRGIKVLNLINSQKKLG